jgi:VWFA-related protein
LLVAALLPWQPPTFRSSVELVEVAVLVRDRDGRFVPDLTQADFEVVEQGAPQRIVAFDRVSLEIVKPAKDAPALPAVPQDVASNQHVAGARVFVLLLDALHIDTRRTQQARNAARQFVLEHVAATDLAAVVSPGGLDSATQDFTSDKTRLLAAIDRFSGTKLPSAAAGIEEERRAVERGGIAVHDGRDPDDAERMRRAASLSDVLEALAKHLGGVERRRKALLLFSEGIDYNQADAMGRQSRYASEVSRAMSRAFGALMRSNVSVYAVDPRGLSSAEGGFAETPSYGLPRGVQGIGASIDQEYADSLASLRRVSDATGGFAALDTNSFGSAFERIVEDSSHYYVLGYEPSKPLKPGELREIGVRVSRPGVTVVARKGHAAPAARSGGSRLEAGDAPVPVAPLPGARPRGRPEGLLDMSAPAAAPRRLVNELQLLLASPLPRAGLPMRVQAIPFHGDSKKGAVQLVVEVLGGGLQFGERSGRFEEHIELALLTVDAHAKADNGRSSSIDLRLTPEDLQRVKATGVRWLTRLELAPGHYQVRVAGRAARTGATGLVTVDVEVPRWAPDRPALSGVTLTSLTSVLMLTKGDAKSAGAIESPPSAARTFVAGDRLTALVLAYAPKTLPELELVTTVFWSDGSRNPPLRKKLAAGVGEEVAIPIDTSLLAPGAYVLRIALAGSELPERVVPFEITAAPSR